MLYHVKSSIGRVTGDSTDDCDSTCNYFGNNNQHKEKSVDHVSQELESKPQFFMIEVSMNLVSQMVGNLLHSGWNVDFPQLELLHLWHVLLYNLCQKYLSYA